jgi:hypothetical protein
MGDLPVLVTVETDGSNADALYMRATASACGWRVVVAGEGVEWRGVETKVAAYIAALETLAPTTLVLQADARDVVVLREPSSFAAAFAAYGKPLVVSMEMFAEGFMDFQPHRKHPSGEPYTYCQTTDLAPYFQAVGVTMRTGSRRHVNSGLMAGTAAALLDFWRWAAAHGIADDQKALGAYMCAHPSRVAADTAAALLHTCVAGCYGGSDYGTQLDDAPTLLELSGRGPFALHVPGLNTSSGQRTLYTWVKRFDAPRMRTELQYATPDWSQFAIARGAVPGTLRPPPSK